MANSEGRSTNESSWHGNMRERAYQQLRHLLILQQVSAGERLREAEWTQRLKVNRSALREAFARLAAEGLIEMGPKTGYFVPALGGDSIREILAVRVMLEAGAIDIICEAGYNTASRLKPMKNACDQLERLISENYFLSVAEADWRFHDALIDATGNKRLASVYHHAPLPIIIPDVISGPRWEAAVRQTVQEHRAVLTAILAGDAPKARQLLRFHLIERSTLVAEAR